jgi:hypothetical protein
LFIVAIFALAAGVLVGAAAGATVEIGVGLAGDFSISEDIVTYVSRNFVDRC